MKKSTTMFDFFKRKYSNSFVVNVGLPTTNVAIPIPKNMDVPILENIHSPIPKKCSNPKKYLFPNSRKCRYHNFRKYPYLSNTISKS